jgi:hypothetical protein
MIPGIRIKSFRSYSKAIGLAFLGMAIVVEFQVFIKGVF